MVLNGERIVSSWHPTDNVPRPRRDGALWRSSVSQLQPTLPTNRAFVVQFRAQPSRASRGWEGRVEHVVSGQMTHFHSLAELLAFIRRVLNDIQIS
jgi:hypothetical protein